MGKTMVTFYMLAVMAAAAAVMINVVGVAAADDSPAPTAVSPTAAAATTYTNHTVGGVAGWFFNSATNQSSFNYTDWAAGQVFGLGDYLIFKTDSNSSVIQTYNLTTYKSCSIDDSSDTDTSEYISGNSDFGVGIVLSVALTKVGPQYYFSQTDDGIQCQNGMAFEIVVVHGLGLPPSLNQPPPPPFVEQPSTVDEGQPSDNPVTIIKSPPNSSGCGNGGGGGFLGAGMMMVLLSFVF